MDHKFKENELISTENGAREGPGEVPVDHGGSSGSPGVSRGGPGEPFGLPRATAGEPFGLHFGCLFGYIFL